MWSTKDHWFLSYFSILFSQSKIVLFVFCLLRKYVITELTICITQNYYRSSQQNTQLSTSNMQHIKIPMDNFLVNAQILVDHTILVMVNLNIGLFATAYTSKTRGRAHVAGL